MLVFFSWLLSKHLDQLLSKRCSRFYDWLIGGTAEGDGIIISRRNNFDSA